MTIGQAKNTSLAKRQVRPKRKKKNVAPRDRLLENAGCKWRVRIGPTETVLIAENAPVCQLVVQNQGPGPVGVRCGHREAIILTPGKLRLMVVRGDISIESPERATVDMDFMPREKTY